MAFAPPFQRPFSATFYRRAAAAAPWWLSGGVAAANAVAVYQPKGAASLAASYSNLANPGTYDAAPGVAPTWDAATGWTFAAASSQYLTTGITPTLASGYTPWSVLVQFSGSPAAGQMLFGCGIAGESAANAWKMQPNIVNVSKRYHNGGRTGAGAVATAGNMAMAGQTGYFDGAFNVTFTGGSFATAYPIFLGAINTGAGAAEYLSGNMQAVAIYNTTLTAAQVFAVSTAMAAL